MAPENDFTNAEKWLIYVAMCFYEENGLPGLELQDRSAELEEIWRKLISKLEEIASEKGPFEDV